MYDSNIFFNNINHKIPNFLSDYIHTFIQLGSLSKDNFLGPNSGTYLSKDYNLSLKKSYAEAIERRVVMSNFASNNIITLKNLLNLKESMKISKKYLSLQDSDTTGTAAGTNEIMATKNAIIENMQKNDIINLWFFKKNSYVIHSSKTDYVFVSLNFYPLVTVTRIFKNSNYFICGIGTDFNFKKANKKALIEENSGHYQLIEDIDMDFYSPDHKLNNTKQRCINLNWKRIKSLNESLPTISKKHNIFYNNEDLTIDNILKTLKNNNIKEVYPYYINNNFSKNIVVCRVYIPSLFQCTPNKYLIEKQLKYRGNLSTHEKNIIKNTINCLIV